MRGFFLRIIELYQRIKFIFPLQCKFIPSCSQYAKEALLKYPLRKALGKIFLRIIRCHPFSKGGIDLP
ncbi:MAG: membrane protein insertion efficiency factor YidD [Candidatus Omnitrophica bacterium 4484_70.1]|nr:MAG: membrane protein insertion efficiency factor YidD [Candidatus Omnitrophica bacterium 4484_70.1]